MRNAEKTVRSLLEYADVGTTGTHTWDMQIHNPIVYQQILSRGRLGAGETYMAGLWDCEDLEELFYRLLQSRLDLRFKLAPNIIFTILTSKLFNLNKKSRAFQIGKHHYDIDIELYKKMLDPTLCYSCAYWPGSDNLVEAQQAKLAMICKKLNLQPGMKVLDIGCGWGSFAKYAVENYGVEVVGLTVSAAQADYARNICKDYPITIKVQDYRDEHGKYDIIVSVGMFEHVGRKNYKTYMQVIDRCLREDGLALVHSIGLNAPVTAPDPWIDKYIFPNGDLPTMAAMARAMESYFIIEDWHNFGFDYSKTLVAWHDNLNNHKDYVQQTMGSQFFRMWNYWLLSCAGVFRARQMQLWQVVLSKSGLKHGFDRHYNRYVI